MSSSRASRRVAARVLPFVAGFVLLATACAGGATPRPSAGQTPAASLSPTTPSPTLASPASPTADTFPLTLSDDEGAEVTIPARPERIASLTPAVTETLFAIGAGGALVARVEDPAVYPPEAGPIPAVAAFGTVDVEKIVGLDVDLVIAGGLGFTPPEAIARLRALGYPVVVVYAPDVEGVLADVELVGRAVGETAAATALARAMRAGIHEVAAAVQRADAPRVFYEIDATKEIYGPAEHSFLEEMVTLAGGEPITTGSSTTFEIPLERLVAADPEIIVLGDAAYGVTAAQVAARPGWSAMTAVRNGAIRPVDDIAVTRPGPRLVDGLRALALGIDPAASLPSARP